MCEFAKNRPNYPQEVRINENIDLTIPKVCWGLSIFDKVRFFKVEKIGKTQFPGFLKNAIFFI